MKHKKLWLAVALVLLLLAIILAGILSKKIKVNTIWADNYPIQGIDVSHYQGDIDWKKLQEQRIDFAYIKATEGSSWVDECFETNWDAAAQTDMKVGAYHFFSFDSEGETQAENYISNVGELGGKLIPVVDVEYYGDKAVNSPEKESVVSELTEMLMLLEQEYGVKPMIYTTYVVYYKYLEGEFEEYPLWIRDVYLTPDIALKNQWTVWQYTDTAVLDGYQGTEKYIDRNVFVGAEEELESLVVTERTQEKKEF